MLTNRNLHIADWNENGVTTLENSLAILQKLKHEN
jgi:hypothetical protein